jgi:predicted phosphoribosyltransferase
MTFRDPMDAGRQLAVEIGRQFGVPSVVAAVSSGGGLVAAAVARAFGRPLVFAYCAPLLLPWDREQAFGAVNMDGRTVLDYGAIAAFRLSQVEVEEARLGGMSEVARFYASGFPSIDEALPASRVLLVDVGLKPGLRMEAALVALRYRAVRKVIVAAPCAPEGAAAWFRQAADGFVTLAVDEGTTSSHFERPEQDGVKSEARLLARCQESRRATTRRTTGRPS